MISIKGDWKLILTAFFILFKLLENVELSWAEVLSPLWLGLPIEFAVRLIRELMRK
jgi:ubiquinone biosynthesis protein UbiJ